MNALRSIREGIGRAWENMASEWSHFMNKASGALTRFTPSKNEKEDSGSMDLVRNTPRLAFMASEIMESDKEVIARVEAPGMETGDFQVEIVNDHLVIRGSKSMQREEKGARYHVMERAYGSFTRSLTLPAEVEVSKAKAKYKNGVLNITMPKTERGRRKSIEVKVH